jgi:hypothetical protein
MLVKILFLLRCDAVVLFEFQMIEMIVVLLQGQEFLSFHLELLDSEVQGITKCLELHIE